jgi:hypothetical protein
VKSSPAGSRRSEAVSRRPGPGKDKSERAGTHRAGAELAQLLSSHLEPLDGCEQAADPAIVRAIESALEPGYDAPRTPDIGGKARTADLGKAIAEAV